MDTIKDFTDLKVWQFAHKFIIQIYIITKEFPVHERYGLINQLRRAAVSITSNIAEGFSRFSYKDRVRFYLNARGSLSECQNQILISRDIGYLESKKTQDLLQEAIQIRQLLNGLIRATKQRIK